MDYRQWEHESRDPRDRGPARPRWSFEDDDWRDPLDSAREWPASAYPPDRHDGWSAPVDDAAGEWAEPPSDSWAAGTGWASGHAEPESDYYADSGYPTRYPVSHPSRYPTGGTYRYPDDHPSARPGPEPAAENWRHGRVLDHDDWYEHPPTSAPPGPPPAPRRPAEMVHVPRRAHIRAAAADHDDSRQSYLSAMVAAAVWFGVPVVLYVLWALTRSGTPDPNCVDAAGNPCAAPRTEALTALVDNLPRLAIAVTLSFVIALIVRWSNATWRAATVGFASVVVGAGTATLVFSLVPPA